MPSSNRAGSRRAAGAVAVRSSRGGRVRSRWVLIQCRSRGAGVVMGAVEVPAAVVIGSSGVTVVSPGGRACPARSSPDPGVSEAGLSPVLGVSEARSPPVLGVSEARLSPAPGVLEARSKPVPGVAVARSPPVPVMSVARSSPVPVVAVARSTPTESGVAEDVEPGREAGPDMVARGVAGGGIGAGIASASGVGVMPVPDAVPGGGGTVSDGLADAARGCRGACGSAPRWTSAVVTGRRPEDAAAGRSGDAVVRSPTRAESSARWRPRRPPWASPSGADRV